MAKQESAGSTKLPSSNPSEVSRVSSGDWCCCVFAPACCLTQLLACCQTVATERNLPSACCMAASQHGESCGAEGAAEQRRGPGGRQSATGKATGQFILGRLNPSCSSSSCSSSSCSSCSSSWTVGPKAPGLRALSYPAPCPSSPQALPIGSRPEVMLSWLASQAATWRGVSWVVTAAQLQQASDERLATARLCARLRRLAAKASYGCG